MTQVQALELTEYLKNEKEYVPFVSAISSLGYIGGMLLTRPGYKIYEVKFLFIYFFNKTIYQWRDN